jgi:hypothetical protein
MEDLSPLDHSTTISCAIECSSSHRVKDGHLEPPHTLTSRVKKLQQRPSNPSLPQRWSWSRRRAHRVHEALFEGRCSEFTCVDSVSAAARGVGEGIGASAVFVYHCRFFVFFFCELSVTQDLCFSGLDISICAGSID